MKVIAVMIANLDETPLGTRSRLCDELDGVPVLRRTIDRVAKAMRVGEIHVVCPVEQHARCAALLADAPITLHPAQIIATPWRSLVRSARKWSLDGWRGGLGGTTSYDEFMDASLLAQVLETVTADYCLCVPSAAAAFDPVLADRMIDHQDCVAEEEEITMTFTQAPPGLSGLLLHRDAVDELAKKSIPIGWVFGYQPDVPRKDQIFLPGCCEIPVELRYAAGRLQADTSRGVSSLEAFLAADDVHDEASVGRWLMKRASETVQALPREVEIELTTQDSYPNALLRPRGQCVPARGPIKSEIVRNIAEELSAFDDSLMVLGGFGDPLLHPHFPAILAAIRTGQRSGSPIFGIAVRTHAAVMTDEHIDAMIDNQVDILNIVLDAWSPDLYGQLMSPNSPSSASLEHVRRNMDRVTEKCQQRGSAIPLVVPEITKAKENVQELDVFFDGWYGKLGTVAISGASHYAHQFADHSVMNMAPSPRTACSRVRNRCVVLANGDVVLCDQDFRGRSAIGSLTDNSLAQIWRSKNYQQVRDAHSRDDYSDHDMCATCSEWHRP